MIRAAFLGTPAEAVPILEAVSTVATITTVVTRPDRPRGRSGRPAPPPVKLAAMQAGWEVAQPARSADLAGLVAGCDVAVVAAYGRLIPASALVVPPAGFVNVHFSLLPRWRGASPVVRAILAGDAETGVTLMRLDEGLDTGPTYDQATVAIGPEETAGELTARLAGLGAGLLRDRLATIVAGDLPVVAQDDATATAAARVEVAEAFVDPERHHRDAVLRAVRAFHPRPGAWAIADGLRIKLWRTRFATGDAPPGWAGVVDGVVLLGARDGAVELVEVQPEGRAVMSGRSWMAGRRDAPARFGRP